MYKVYTRKGKNSAILDRYKNLCCQKSEDFGKVVKIIRLYKGYREINVSFRKIVAFFKTI